MKDYLYVLEHILVFSVILENLVYANIRYDNIRLFLVLIRA